jgi:LysM repeat protein
MKTMLVGMGMVVAAASLGLVACGSDSSTANSSPPIDVGATNFVTIPPVPVTEPPITTAPDAPGSILEFESEYTVVDGDLPSTVAAKFKVKFEDFMTINNFTLDENQFVPEWTGTGMVVKIPAGATVPGEPVATVATTAAPGTETTEAPTEATTATTDAPDTTTTTSDCTPGSYTIDASDTSRQKVADKFDVSVAALDAANGNTNGYSSFYAGLKIVIPC